MEGGAKIIFLNTKKKKNRLRCVQYVLYLLSPLSCKKLFQSLFTFIYTHVRMYTHTGKSLIYTVTEDSWSDLIGILINFSLVPFHDTFYKGTCLISTQFSRFFSSYILIHMKMTKKIYIFTLEVFIWKCYIFHLFELHTRQSTYVLTMLFSYKLPPFCC